MAVWATIGKALSSIGKGTTDLFAAVGLTAGDGERSREAAFSMAVVALAAKLAKADGVVTASEVEVFWRRFDIPPNAHPPIRRLFELAQKDVAGFQAYAEKVVKLFPDDLEIREDLLDVLFSIAAADRLMHLAELAYLKKVADIFGIDEVHFERIKARHLEPEGNPHAVLGTDPCMTFAQIRKAYLKLVAEHHPDRLAARGVPADFHRLANDRLAAINAAYDALERSRAS